MSLFTRGAAAGVAAFALGSFAVAGCGADAVPVTDDIAVDGEGGTVSDNGTVQVDLDDSHFVLAFTPVEPSGGSREPSAGFTSTGEPIVFTVAGDWIRVTGAAEAADVVLGPSDSWLLLNGDRGLPSGWLHLDHEHAVSQASGLAEWVDALRDATVADLASLRPGAILFDELIESIEVVDDHTALVDLVGTDVDVEVTVRPLGSGTRIEPPTEVIEIDELLASR